MADAIRYWDRAAGREETEQVYGEGAVRWLYESRVGRVLADGPLTAPWFSSLYGALQSSALSRRKIRPFIEAFRIPMQEYVDPGFGSFNDFFIRRFRPGARPFAPDPAVLAAPAEARYLAWERVSANDAFPVKGVHLSAEALLGGGDRARPFAGGPLLLARLCPTDYHRFHFPDGGRVLEHYRLGGRLHSVNPVALRYRGEILSTNERQVTLLETDGFGRLAYVEVGALCVGRIVQSAPLVPGTRFARGDEKGYFLFGGSTVVVLGEPGKWKPDADLLEQTARRMETLVRLGSPVARRAS
jgi:phosphatidylserine decarboxylase